MAGDTGHWCHNLVLRSRPGLLKVGSRPHFGVVTWFVQTGLKRRRDPVLRSRPGLACLRSQPHFVVATWPRLLDELGHNSVRRACGHDQLAVRAAERTTWALRAQCARDLGFGCAHYAHNPVL